MKIFTSQQKINEALFHAMRGGQAILVWRLPKNTRGISIFPDSPEDYRLKGVFGYLIDQDANRLVSTVKQFGMLRVSLHLGRTSNHQHIILKQQYLGRAIRMAHNENSGDDKSSRSSLHGDY
jgi:hypothetical protein